MLDNEKHLTSFEQDLSSEFSFHKSDIIYLHFIELLLSGRTQPSLGQKLNLNFGPPLQIC